MIVTTNYGQVSLSWSAVSNATSYNVKRSTTSSSETAIANTASTSYADTNVVNGTTYYYVVSAVNSGGESANSAEVTTTPPIPPMPAPPSGTVLLDFDGQSDAMPSPDVSGFYWNNISTVASTVGGTILPLNGSSQPIPLVNTTNGNPGWTLAINQLGPYGFDANSAPEGDDWNGPYPAAVAVFPQTALAHGFTIGGPISVTLSGLNSSLTCNLLIYGAYAAGGQCIQTNTLTVGTSPSPAINTFNVPGNSTTAVGWTNVTPSAGGQITFTITSSGVGALNFMEVSPVSTNTTSTTNPPAAPAILNVTTNYGQVSLTWSAVATATSYNVKRATTSGAETNLVSTAYTSYTDASVANGTMYYYVVSAVNNIGESTNSTEVHATPPIPPPPPSSAPTILTVTTTTPGQVGLTWSVVGNATSYNVKRATASGAETTIATTASTAYTDPNVVGGITFYYVVSAVNYSGESPNSAEVTATPLSPAVLYLEDWGTTNGGANVTTVADVGWNQVLATDFYSGFFQSTGMDDATGAGLPANSMWFGDNNAGRWPYSTPPMARVAGPMATAPSRALTRRYLPTWSSRCIHSGAGMAARYKAGLRCKWGAPGMPRPTTP